MSDVVVIDLSFSVQNNFNLHSWFPKTTTGLALFAECRIHSAKALLHSVKGLPSVALGKPHSVKKVTAKAPLPSVFFRALGKVFAECQKTHGKFFETRLEKQRLKIAKHFIFTR